MIINIEDAYFSICALFLMYFSFWNGCYLVEMIVLFLFDNLWNYVSIFLGLQDGRRLALSGGTVFYTPFRSAQNLRPPDAVRPSDYIETRKGI